jgi:hypothetical protein
MSPFYFMFYPEDGGSVCLQKLITTYESTQSHGPNVDNTKNS